MNIEPVRKILDELRVSYALIGAHAMAARGYPRFTVDIDLLTTDSRVLDGSTWAGLAGGGATIDARRGDDEDPLAGVVHILLADGSDIDVVVGRWQWEERLIRRAELMPIAPGVDLPVPSTSDLILLKLAAGGSLDLHDAAALLALGDQETLIREVNATIGEVYPDVRGLWSELQQLDRKIT